MIEFLIGGILGTGATALGYEIWKKHKLKNYIKNNYEKIKLEEIAKAEAKILALRQKAHQEILFYKNLINDEKIRAQNTYKDEEENLKQKLLEFELNIESAKSELSELREQLRAYQATHSVAAIEDQQERNKLQGDRISLTEHHKSEIQELLKIVNRFSNPTPLYKAIFELFYRTPIKDLIAYQGAAGVAGIYKILDLHNQKVYVGQSVNIGDRWMAHCRRGTGCDVGTLASGKLYEAMLEGGIWNFTFEIVQECTKEQLNELEKYYIGLWATDKVGYNMKRG